MDTTNEPVEPEHWEYDKDHPDTQPEPDYDAAEVVPGE